MREHLPYRKITVSTLRDVVVPENFTTPDIRGAIAGIKFCCLTELVGCLLATLPVVVSDMSRQLEMQKTISRTHRLIQSSPTYWSLLSEKQSEHTNDIAQQFGRIGPVRKMRKFYRNIDGPVYVVIDGNAF
jgi:hypothetical protein